MPCVAFSAAGFGPGDRSGQLALKQRQQIGGHILPAAIQTAPRKIGVAVCDRSPQDDSALLKSEAPVMCWIFSLDPQRGRVIAILQPAPPAVICIAEIRNVVCQPPKGQI